MRLEASEIAGIKQAINKFIDQDLYVLYLFGSRVDSDKKGGDIDLLLVIKNRDMIISIKHKIMAEIKYNIGDQKIDLVIAEKPELSTEAFLREIMKTAVRL